MDITVNGIGPVNAGPAKLIVVLSATVDELTNLQAAIEGALHGRGNTLECGSSVGVPLRVIIDRIGPAVAVQ